MATRAIDVSETTKAAPLEAGRFAYLLPILAVAGALVCAGQVIYWSWLGAWPFHDTAAYLWAGLHIRDGSTVYVPGAMFLAFLYSPPIAALAVPLSFLTPEVASVLVLVSEVLALRYIMGSWRNVGLVAWLPFVPREFATGNVNLLMAASIYAAVRGVRGSGYLIALFGAMKVAPALVLLIANRRQWKETIIGSVVLLALTIPVLHLWPEWLAISGSVEADRTILLIRIPIVLVLIALRRPWSIAAAAGIATPAIYFHSLVLLLPAARLWWAARQVPSGAPARRAAGAGGGGDATTAATRSRSSLRVNVAEDDREGPAHLADRVRDRRGRPI